MMMQPHNAQRVGSPSCQVHGVYFTERNLAPSLSWLPQETTEEVGDDDATAQCPTRGQSILSGAWGLFHKTEQTGNIQIANEQADCASCL